MLHLQPWNHLHMVFASHSLLGKQDWRLGVRRTEDDDKEEEEEEQCSRRSMIQYLYQCRDVAVYSLFPQFDTFLLPGFIPEACSQAKRGRPAGIAVVGTASGEEPVSGVSCILSGRCTHGGRL